MFNLHHQAPDEVDGQQVQWIENIEEVFANVALDETTLAIVEVDGNEGQPGYQTHRQIAAANDSL